MKRFYLLVLIYIFINISAYSAEVAERAVFVYSGELQDSLSVNKRENSPIEILRGSSIKLATKLLGDVANVNYYYVWQMSTDGQHWEVVNSYWLADNEYEEIMRDEGIWYYRVVVFSEDTNYYQYDDVESCEDCMVSNVVEVIVKSLDMSYEVLNPNPCLTTETLKLRLSVKNSLSRAVENVKINIEDIFGFGEYDFSVLDSSSVFDDAIKQWNVGTLLSGETKTIDVNIKSSLINVYLGVYLSSAEDLRWQSYEYASMKLNVDETFRGYKGNTYGLSTVEICGSLESNLVDIRSSCGIPSNDIRFYEDKDRQNEVKTIDTSIPTSEEGKTYYMVGVDESGCESEVSDFQIVVKKFPKVVMVEPEDTVLCNIDGKLTDKVTIKYKIEGGEPPYTIYYTCSDLCGSGYILYKSVAVKSAEGSFEVFPTMPSEYRITAIYSNDYCWADQEVPPFRIYAPRNREYYINYASGYKVAGEDYTLNFDDRFGEFDTYQWQVSYDNGSTFEDLIDTENPEVDSINVISGAQTSKLKISNLSEIPETASYRVKLSNSISPCVVSYSNSSVLRMFRHTMLALNIYSDFLYNEYICENERVALRCNVFNGSAKDYEDLKLKLDISDSISELEVIPDVGTYDYESKIWSIGKFERGGQANITVAFIAKNDETVRFECDGESTSLSFKVLGLPVVGTLQTPEPVCEGTNLCAQKPDIQEGANVTDVIWHLDDRLIGFDAVLYKEDNGSVLQCEVVNKCGSTMSNKVQVEVKQEPIIGMIDEYISSVCEGEALNLSVPTIETNGDEDIKGRWVLNGETYIEGTPIYKEGDKYYELYYEVEGECGGVIKSPWVSCFNVAESLELKELKTPEPICDNSYLSALPPRISLKGTEIVSERWVLDGEEYNFDMVSYEKNGKKLYYEVTQSCNGKISVVRSNEVELTVLPPVEISDIPEVYEYKEGQALELTKPTVEYGVEPNEYIKYEAKWSLLDENEFVVVDDYNGQPIYNDDIIKKIRYEVSPIIYFSPEYYSHCEHEYSNAAQLFPEIQTAIEVVMQDEDETIWATAITPYNKNGLNDTFAEGMRVKVFDSRLQQIFEGDNGWDGTANMGSHGVGAIQPPGVYYYSVVLPSGEKKLGLIEIVRM